MSEYTIIFAAMDIMFVVFFLLGLLGGFIRGTFRQSIRAIITIGLVLGGFIIASPVTKKFLQLNISLPFFDKNISVIENIYKIVADKFFQGDMNKMIATGVSEVVYDVTFSVGRLVVGIGLGIASLLVLAPLIKIVVLAIVRVIRRKKPGFFGRIGGMVVAAVEFVILFCIFILPLYGALEVATKTIHEVASFNEDMAIIDQDLTELTESSTIYKFTSNFGKTKKTHFGIGGKSFGTYISVKAENGKVNFIKDLDAILPFANRAIIIYQEMEKAETIDEKIDVITEDDIEQLLYVLEKSDIIEYAYPIAIKCMRTYSTEKEMLIALNLDYDVLLTIDFNNDIATSSDFIKKVYNLAQSIDLDNASDVEQYLNNAEIAPMISDTFASAMKIELFKECFPKIAYYVINKSMKEDKYLELVKLITPEYLKNDFANDLEVLANVYQTAKETDVIDYFKKVEKEYSLTKDMETKLIETTKKVAEIKLFQDNYPTLIEQVGPYVKDVLPLDIEQMVLEDVDWNKETKILLEVLVYGYELLISGDFEDETTSVENSNSSTCLKKIVTTLGNSSLAEKYYYPAVIEFISNIIKKSGFDFTFTDEEKQNIINNTMAKEIDVLFEVITEVKGIFGDDATNGNIDVDNINGDSIATLMKKASESYIASKIIGQLLNDTLGENGLNINPINEATGLPKYDFTNPTVLKIEATSIGKLIDLANNTKNLQKNISNRDEITAQQIESITQIVSHFANNEGSSEIVNDVINNLCETNDITIDENIDWQNEANILTDVLTDYQSSIDKENYDVNDNEELKELIENSEIASSILAYLGILN